MKVNCLKLEICAHGRRQRSSHRRTLAAILGDCADPAAGGHHGGVRILTEPVNPRYTESRSGLRLPDMDPHTQPRQSD